MSNVKFSGGFLDRGDPLFKIHLKLHTLKPIFLPVKVSPMKVSECVWINTPLDTIIAHFGDESFQAIDCSGTDNQKQRNKTLHKH